MPDSLDPQTIEPPGTSAPQAQAVQGVTGGIPVAISGNFSATTAAHATAAAPTYVEGTDNPVSCDLSGNLRTLASLSGASSFTDGSVDRQARVKDADTGAGTHWTAEVILQKAASGGPVDFGTSTDPLRVDPTGATTQPVSAASLPLPTGASQEHTGAASFHSARLTDGAAFYKPTTPSDTQPVSAASLPLPSGASTEATLALIKAKTDNLDVLLSSRTKPADTQKVDGSAVTQPVSGTFWQATQPVSAASLPLPSGAATEATLAGIKTGTDKIPSSPSTDRTTAGAPFSVELSTGAAFYDARQIRALASGTDSVNVGNFPATNDVSDRAARLLGKSSMTDGSLDLALVNAAPASDTNQIAVPVRVISQLGGGGGSISGTDELGNTAAFNFTKGDGRYRLEVHDTQTRRLIEQLLLASMGTSLFNPASGRQPSFSGDGLLVATAPANTFRLIAAGSTNATVVKAGAGLVYGWYMFNAAAATRFVKLYDKAKAPTVGTDTPILTIGLPAGAAANVWFDGGTAFTSGIALAMTVGMADSDVAAVTANDVVVNLFYS